ncbi:hypothetical protein ASPWEDRAFT_643803 [Aspergillus wentii DTO 134E9]|uniref:Uncharacterized protein n=1 Tax=Aspergillus wentii DTO 134E9 TaxID=1073089 RepID=A0A1L9RAM9_ASPWE|nr:uncharacterized protein ASPWEDRAFT_643803 [Aspergillus wentii DTO 134E9]OJJ31982.1 hypothetical protein ASPWEDRAFT_643803 [Aspergillus wentii DTO 134E9]
MSLSGSGSPPAAQNNGGLFGNSNTNNAQTTTTTTFSFGTPAASHSPAPNSNNAQTGQSTLAMRHGGFSSASTATQNTPEPDNTKIKRSGCVSTPLFPTDINEPDPNGDVTLIVTPRKKPQGLFSDIQSANPTEQPATRFRVSSRHLMLASTYFEGRLSTRWPEGEELKNKGSVELQIPDADPDAFLIILNVIHGRLNRVPRVVTLETLTEVAILTDYFQCHEPLGLFPSKWVDSLRSPVPRPIYLGGLNWILISWVFGIDDIFTSSTKFAQRQLTRNLTGNEFELPIPGNIRGS